MSQMIASKGPHTPNFDDSDLSLSSTRYLNVASLPWVDTVYDGIEMKILFKDQMLIAMVNVDIILLRMR